MQRSIILFVMYKQLPIIILVYFFTSSMAWSQTAIPTPEDSILTNGQVVRIWAQDGDTLYLADLEDVSITANRLINNNEEYKLYHRYKRYATDVYPYAKEAIEVYRQIQQETEDLKKGKKKKYIRQLNKDYKADYKDKFKNMTRTQGRVMIKMIERELDISFFDLIKEVKGGFTAQYWDALSGLYGYHLKEKYQKGQDVLLDAVLEDFNIKAKLQ